MKSHEMSCAEAILLMTFFRCLTHTVHAPADAASSTQSLDCQVFAGGGVGPCADAGHVVVPRRVRGRKACGIAPRVRRDQTRTRDCNHTNRRTWPFVLSPLAILSAFAMRNVLGSVGRAFTSPAQSFLSEMSPSCLCKLPGLGSGSVRR